MDAHGHFALSLWRFLATRSKRMAKYRVSTVQRLECLTEKSRQIPAIDVLVRCFSGRVMPARKHGNPVIQSMALELRYHLAGKLGQKGQIVLCVNDQRLPLEPGKLLEVGHRTDGRPQATQAIQGNFRFEALTNVACGLAMPHHVREIGGGMIKSGDFDAGIMRGREKCVTGTEAGPDNAQALVSLLLKPVEAAADVEHTLARSIERTFDVRRNRVLGAADFSRAADVVVGHAQPQHRNSQAIQNSAERIVA